MIDVLVVDDSAVVREYLAFLMGSDPTIRVSGTAANGQEALASVRSRPPGLVLMDIHMPVMDGFEAARAIMAEVPVPIVMITASTDAPEVETAMRALQAGALAVVKKPGGPGSPGADQEALELLKMVKLMAQVAVVGRRQGTRPAMPASPPVLGRQIAVVAIGASTGGPPALLSMFSRLPRSFPAPLLVVQHLTRGFVQGFADWLAHGCGFPVHVAAGGEWARPGHVYVAPDDLHLKVGHGGRLMVSGEPPVHGLRPSADVLFSSVAESCGARAAGVLLSGMGRDGAAGLKLLFQRGALTIVQDEQTSTVFGMPGEAIGLGAASCVLPPPEIADLLAGVAMARR